jgi:hypothetical protein
MNLTPLTSSRQRLSTSCLYPIPLIAGTIPLDVVDTTASVAYLLGLPTRAIVKSEAIPARSWHLNAK